jgi:hypothetical protein
MRQRPLRRLRREYPTKGHAILIPVPVDMTEAKADGGVEAPPQPEPEPLPDIEGQMRQMAEAWLKKHRRPIHRRQVIECWPSAPFTTKTRLCLAYRNLPKYLKALPFRPRGGVAETPDFSLRTTFCFL